MNTITTEMTTNTPTGWTFKAFKHNETLSEETHCFSATLYINGKRAAAVSNHGHGGCDNITWASDAMRDNALAVAAASSYGFDANANFECIIGDMVEDALFRQAVREQLRKIQRRNSNAQPFPIGVYAEDNEGGFVFGLYSMDALLPALRRHNANTYRLFTF